MSEELRKAAMVNAYLKRQSLVDEAVQYEMKPFVLPPLHGRRSSDRPRTTPSRRILPLPSLRRRTTAALDFPLHPPALPNRNRKGLCSPTRKNNPQPGGLAFQNPYNRHNRSYEIWQPNLNVIEANIPGMMEHLRDVNFVCKHSGYNLSPNRGIPEVKYSDQSSYRQMFQQADLNTNGQYVHPTRFGHRPNTRPAVGIVPNAIARKHLNQ